MKQDAGSISVLFVPLKMNGGVFGVAGEDEHFSGERVNLGSSAIVGCLFKQIVGSDASGQKL